jgi:putative tricarboxylic transport membrane protein
MARRRGGKGAGTQGNLFSFIGTVIGIICLVIMAPALSRMALKFGAYEYLALSIFSYSW